MAKKPFEKFINKPVKGAKVKEAFRQEKKAAVKERREGIERHFEEKRRLKAEQYLQRGTNPNQSTKGGPAPSAGNTDRKKAFAEKPRVEKKESVNSKIIATYKKQLAAKNAVIKSETPKKATPKPVGKNNTNRISNKKNRDIIGGEVNEITPRVPGSGNYTPKDPIESERMPLKNKGIKPASPKKSYDELTADEIAMNDALENSRKEPRSFDKNAKKTEKKSADSYPQKDKPKKKDQAFDKKKTNDGENKDSGDMPLNKFLAHAGLCSRRDAADVVKKGTVTVNGQTITDPGFKVTDDADVKVEGKPIKRSKNLVYILMNKPKDYITTAEDPQGRKTVMDIIKHATTERVYPIGRLDRNTSGVLLFTNDGDMAQKLSHPSFEVRKIYEVRLDKSLQKDDFEKILSGVQLEDGEVHADSLAYGDKDKSVVGIEIHSGKNRVVRRIFESMGYDVKGLDRVMYANLTKKNVERGKWRFLNDKEVRLLKYFNKSKQK